MDEIFYLYCKPIKVIVFLTFLHTIFGLQYKKNKTHLYLLIILMTCLLTELAIPLLRFYSVPTGIYITISVIIHHSAWLLILGENVIFKKLYFVLFISFYIFCFFNLFLLSGYDKFNYYTFVAGAFIYISVFIYESFYQLKKENFSFFLI